MKFTLQELVKITRADLLKADIDTNSCFEISTDTRTIDSTKVFLPIIGEKFNGHNFINDALKNGATGYFTKEDIIFDNAKSIMKVKDTKIAYLQIANYYKRQINPKTIAITGSAGKTTTKEMAYHVFKQQFKTHKSELNHNNEIGLAQTLLSMPKDTEALIVEMGMRGLGEIELLSKYAEPNIAIISNIGSAHIGRLGSIENIAKAKFEITKYLKPDGLLIANKNEYLDKINNIKDKTINFSLKSGDLKILKLDADYSEFKYKGHNFRINLSGEYNIQNALGVIEAAICYGIPFSKIAKGLEEFKPIENRWQIENIFGANIINDAYNANPESMIATVKNFLSVYNGRKILVLGDMGELGENEISYHRAVGEEIKNLKFDLLLTVGDLSRYISDVNATKSVHYATTDGCSYYLKNNIKDGDWILLKASRAMHFEKIIENLNGGNK